MLATARLHEGPTLRLRRVVPDDAPLLFERLYGDDAFRRLYSRRARVDSVEALRAHIAAQWPDGPERTGHLAFIVERVGVGPIGTGALTGYDPAFGRAELLLGFFDPSHRGHGLASEAAALALDLAFNAYRIHKLTCQVYGYNAVVRDMLVHLGFSPEATRRDHVALDDGSRADLHVLGLTARAFRSQPRWSERSRRLLGYDITVDPIEVDRAPAVSRLRPSGRPAPRALLCAALAFGAVFAHPQAARADVFEVTEAVDDGTGQTPDTLSWAIRQANVNPGPDAIKLSTDVTLSGPMKVLIDGQPSGGDHDDGGGAVSIRSDGIRRTIDGADTYRPLFVRSGTVVIDDVTIAHGHALGGSGGTRGHNGTPNVRPRSENGGAGGGGGLGGGLFVHSGTVYVHDVDFVENQATGGDADLPGVEGGGGMFGAGFSGGGGLFASSTGNSGGYGNAGHYGGSGGIDLTPGQLAGGFGGGGARFFQGQPGLGGFGGGGGLASAGGFGGGGGGGNRSTGAAGGFGGGGGAGGYYTDKDGNTAGWSGTAGGYGGGRGGTVTCNPGFPCSKNRVGGGGAGFGGAIFARHGSVALIDVTFTDNAVTGGTGNAAGSAEGADVFVCTSGLHASASQCAATVNACGTTTTAAVLGTLGSDCPADLPCVEDSDGDGTCDEQDACPFVATPDDADGDGVCDNVDLCAGDDATGDEDADGICSDADLCLGDNTSGDTDADGVCDDLDPCPLDNADDSDGDGSCDSADLCIGDDTSGDGDADGVCESDDPCPVDNPDDSDDDGVCDSADPCPVDNPDDSDGDGSCDADDLCEGNDAAGDTDGDGVCTDLDPCPVDDPDDADDDGVCASADICVGDNALGDPDGDRICGREGCGCASTPVPTQGLWVGMLGLLGLRRRRS